MTGVDKRNEAAGGLADASALLPHHSLLDAGLIGPAGSCYLDLSRVVATNLVMVGHCLAIFHLGEIGVLGGLGVTIFFLLSGFLITTAAFRKSKSDEPQLRSFMIDRCARIFVPFVPILILVAILNTILDFDKYGLSGVNTGPLAFLANLFLLNDFPLMQAATHFIALDHFYPRAYNTAEPFWTIPVEFWTYVVFAAFYFVFLRRERPSWLFALLVVFVGLPIFLWNAFAGGGGGLSLVWMLGSIGAWFWFSSRAEKKKHVELGLILIGFSGLCLLGRVMKAGLNPYEFQQGFLIALLLFGGFLVCNAVTGELGWFGKVARLLAGYSYSLYLVHNTVLILFHKLMSHSAEAALIAMVASHIAAFGLYLLFERRYHEVGAWLKNRLPTSLRARAL
jgi:peptidoglycan/LPS O-acetylase OafA/YrhL